MGVTGPETNTFWERTDSGSVEGHARLRVIDRKTISTGDAVAMKLPLLGGRHSIHDWNYLLTELGLLDFTRPIAITIYTIGTILIALATFFSIKHAYR